jgi:hypothetical protein
MKLRVNTYFIRYAILIVFDVYEYRKNRRKKVDNFRDIREKGVTHGRSWQSAF